MSWLAAVNVMQCNATPAIKFSFVWFSGTRFHEKTRCHEHPEKTFHVPRQGISIEHCDLEDMAAPAEAVSHVELSWANPYHTAYKNPYVDQPFVVAEVSGQTVNVNLR